MDYSNNGFETTGILNASSNSISIDLSPGNTVSRENNSSENYGYVSEIENISLSAVQQEKHRSNQLIIMFIISISISI